MPYTTVRGISLYYEQHGDPADPPLIIAHGLMGSIAYMRDQAAKGRGGERIEDIADRGLHVTVYDARGHGRSGYTTERADYHWDALAQDMRELIRRLNIERTTIYGGSMGAGTALAFALAHPDAVDKLIIQSPPPFEEKADGEPLRSVGRLFGGLAMLYQTVGVPTAARIVAGLARARGAEPDEIAELRAFIGRQRRAPVIPAIRGLLLDQPQLDIERFRLIETPTLILTHPDDPIHPLSSGEVLHERMPHARLAVAPTTNYWPENPDALTHVIAAFTRNEPIAQGLPEEKRTHAL